MGTLLKINECLIENIVYTISIAHLSLFILLLGATSFWGQNFNNGHIKSEEVQLFGKVTDFNNRPIDSVLIRVKNKNFDNLYQTLSDKNGNYKLSIKKGIYFALYAIKERDYGKTKLEYWAWNIPIFKDTEINPQYDKLEVYGINVFEPKVKPYDSYRIYFRPMSLVKYLNYNKGKKCDTIDIAPQLTKDEIEIKINNVPVEIKAINRIVEYISKENYLYSYEVQVLKPTINNLLRLEEVEGYNKITVTLYHRKTNEKGKGEYFIKKNISQE